MPKKNRKSDPQPDLAALNEEVEACRDVMESIRWLAEVGAQVCWPLRSHGGVQHRYCSLRWNDLRLEVACGDGAPFDGLVEAAALLRERMERREARTGILIGAAG